MVKTYGLAIETKQALKPLKLPLMTLQQAQNARAYLLGATGKALHVVNIQSMGEI